MDQFKAVHPVLPSKNVSRAIVFYEQLGFQLLFKDAANDPNYAGMGRGNVEIHLQSHHESEWERVERPMLRFKVTDVEALHQEYKNLHVFHENTAIRTTPWHTVEFAFYDGDGNGLTFYRDI